MIGLHVTWTEYGNQYDRRYRQNGWDRTGIVVGFVPLQGANGSVAYAVVLTDSKLVQVPIYELTVDNAASYRQFERKGWDSNPR